MLGEPPKRLTLVSALSLFGVGAAIYLSQIYYDIRAGIGGSSICNINETVNCHAVAASKYAELFAGMPVSSAVAGWFLGIFIVSLIARNPFWRREALRLLLAAVGFGCAFAVYLFYIMAFVLKTYCLFCIGIEIALYASLALLLSLKVEGLKTHPLEMEKQKKMAAVMGVALLVGIGGLKSLDNLASIPQSEMQGMDDQIVNSPVLPVDVSPSDPSEGPIGAPITVVEFSDFQCPHCAHGVEIIRALLARYPGKIRVVFKNFPLDSACNRKVQQSMHPISCEAARVADCANKQGGFFPVYEKLFAVQDSLAPGHVIDVAASTGLDRAKLAECVNSAEAGADVNRDIEEGIRLNVESTPSFFINGHLMMGALPIPIWDQVIERMSQQGAK